MDNNEAACLNSRILFDRCEGSFVDRIELQFGYDSDQFSISLVQVPEVGEVSISLRQVRYLRLDKPPQLGGSFVDEIKVTRLAASDDWPPEAEKMVTRFSGVPDLIWLEVIGPVSINVICEEMSLTPDPSEISNS